MLIVIHKRSKKRNWCERGRLWIRAATVSGAQKAALCHASGPGLKDFLEWICPRLCTWVCDLEEVPSPL